MQSYLIVTDMRLDRETAQTKTEQDCKILTKSLRSAFKKGELENFVALVGTGGGGSQSVAMHELGSGEFPLDSIVILELQDKENPERYYNSFVLKLKDGRACFAKGGSAQVLNDPMGRWKTSLLKRGKITVKSGNSEKVIEEWVFKSDAILKVGKIEQMANGNYKVVNQLLERAPTLPPAEPIQTVKAEIADEDIPF